MKKTSATVDFKNETFETKVKDLIKNLEENLKELQKQNKYHAKIVETLKDDTDPEIRECVEITRDAMTQTMGLIDALNKRLQKSKTLQQFLDGNLILDIDGFAMLMVDVLGSQMVNYIELKAELEAVSKKWHVQ